MVDGGRGFRAKHRPRETVYCDIYQLYVEMLSVSIDNKADLVFKF